MITQTLKKTIADLLNSEPGTRDNDIKLIFAVWKQQTGKNYPYMYEVQNDLMLGRLAHPESIMRIRRKLQQEFPALRGKCYVQRHLRQTEVKQQLGYNV